MAYFEVGRTCFIKRLIDPNETDLENPDSYIDIPCIVSIWWIDPADRQSYQRILRNTKENTARDSNTHVFEVDNQTNNAAGDGVDIDKDNFIIVERIDQLDKINDDQGERLQVSNNDPPPLPPPSDPTYADAQGHLASHVIRYNKDNENDPASSPWVDIEVIDQLALIGYLKQRVGDNPLPSSNDDGQLFVLHLANDPGDSNFSDPDDPYNPTWADRDLWKPQDGDYRMLPQDTDGSSDADGAITPVRIDPFQNIVNVSWGGLAVEFLNKSL